MAQPLRFPVDANNMSKLKWLPKSKVARAYVGAVYGILLPWFIICFLWAELLRGYPVASSELRWQVRLFLRLCSVPPAAGMSVDLLVALWVDLSYKRAARIAGLSLIAIALASATSVS